MRGAPQKGLAWLMRRIRSRMLAATSGLPGRRRDFLVQCQAKARRCQRRTVSGRTISRHRRQPDQHRYNTTHKSRSQRWRRKRRGAFFWQTASWWRSARLSACRAARVRKLEATKVKRATKRELIVVATHDLTNGSEPLRFQIGRSFRYAQAKTTRGACACNDDAISVNTDSHNPLDGCRDSAAWLGFTTTWKTCGDCQTPRKSYKTSHFVG